jgi:methionyl-tRNA formyltransferase
MEELRVDLAAFRGPLDLLLHLVMQEEVDVGEIPLARIADRFLQMCRDHVESLDVDRAGEYLVVASQLLVLKSRALLPRDTPLDLEEIDPRLDLVRQLIEYRDFKQVAGELGRLAAEQDCRAPVQVRGPGRVPREEAELEVDLYALAGAFQRLLRETGDETAVAMPRERLPITHFVEVLFDRLMDAGGRLTFEQTLSGSRNRTYVIGAFLALLELIKLRKILVLQDGMGEIQIQIREEGMSSEDTVDHELASETIENPELGGAARTRVVLMGSPQFAVPVLQSLVGAGMAPVLVVTPPARPSGRGQRRREVPLAVEAERLQLPMHRSSDVNGRTSRDAIEEATPDVIVTAGFGQKLGSALLALPRAGCINLHASLLPRFRGASPIAAALRDGATETGVTIFRMDPEWDRGGIVAQQGVALTGEETADEVAGVLAKVGADLLVRTLPRYLAGEIEPQPQDPEQASYARRLRKEEGAIDWSMDAPRVKNHVRAMTSWPGAQTSWQPKVKHDPLPVVVSRVQVLSEDEQPPLEGREDAPPGTVLRVDPSGIDVKCGEGAVRILRLRPSGGRDMAVKDFLNARRVVAGDRFR